MKFELFYVYDNGKNSDKCFESFTTSGNDYVVVEDEYGRRWKLEPLKNINIQMPFRIVPMEKEK